MRAVVATHGHCFDGLCSAVVFTRLLRALRGPQLDFGYVACGYSASQPDVRGLLDGDENAILDYRFAPSDRLHWYFDHHRTAFASDADRAYFQEHQSGRSFHYDASYSSCTKLVRDVARQRYGIEMPEFDELTRWADKIDSAAFDSPEEALDTRHPVMQLASVVEHHGDTSFITRLVARLEKLPLEEVADSAEHRSRYQKIRRRKADFARHVRQNAETLDRVVLVDLSEAELATYGKFVTYALYPQATYSVIVGRVSNGARINVGYNPWSERGRDHDLSSICGRYGGGGHPFVGGISFPAEDVHKAVDVARAIALELCS